MSSEYTYDEIFQRNIGIFTPEEQEKIKNLKVAIEWCEKYSRRVYLVHTGCVHFARSWLGCSYFVFNVGVGVVWV